MWEWFRTAFRGETWLAAVVALAATLVALRLAPGGEPEAAPTLYETRAAPPPDEGANVTTVEVGRHGSASVHHLRIAESLPAHVHREHDEQIVVLGGAGTLLLDDEAHEVAAGSVVVIPRGTVHSLRVTRGPVEAVSVFSPPFEGEDRRLVE